jgi:hypothetical protein
MGLPQPGAVGKIQHEGGGSLQCRFAGHGLFLPVWVNINGYGRKATRFRNDFFFDAGL